MRIGSIDWIHAGARILTEYARASCSAEGADSLQIERERGDSSLGILPLAKSTKSMGLHQNGLSRAVFGWELPGHGDSYADCGRLLLFGCLNVEHHVQDGLFEGMLGKVYVQMKKRTCLRAECPVCYESWAGKEAGKIEWRLSAWTRGRVIHVIASPKRGLRNGSFADLRRECYVVLKKAGFKGGSVIFHPYRMLKSTKEWYFSPHFHCLGYGWIHHTRELYEASGWIVKNAGTRKTVSGTALYQLSHCGINGKHHSITWFGALSYNKLRVPSQPEPEKEKCPICGAELRPLWYFGRETLPDKEGFYWLDPEGFEYKPVRRWSGG